MDQSSLSGPHCSRWHPGYPQSLIEFANPGPPREETTNVCLRCAAAHLKDDRIPETVRIVTLNTMRDALKFGDREFARLITCDRQMGFAVTENICFGVIAASEAKRSRLLRGLRDLVLKFVLVCDAVVSQSTSAFQYTRALLQFCFQYICSNGWKRTSSESMMIIVASSLKVGETLNKHDSELSLKAYARAASKVFCSAEENLFLRFLEQSLDLKYGLSEYLRTVCMRAATALACRSGSFFENLELEVLNLVFSGLKNANTSKLREESLRLALMMFRSIPDRTAERLDSQLCDDGLRPLFVDALKSSLLSESVVERILVVDLVNDLRRFNKIIVVLVDVGIVDFLFEALGLHRISHDKLGELCYKALEAISFTCDQHPRVLHRTMRHRLGPILDVVCWDRVGYIRNQAFTLLRRGFSEPKYFDVEDVETFLEAVREAGLEVERLGPVQSRAVGEELERQKAVFANGLSALSELLSWYRVPRSIMRALWKTLECAGRVAPSNISGIQAASISIEQFVHGRKEKGSELAQMMQNVIMGTWLSLFRSKRETQFFTTRRGFFSALLRLLSLSMELTSHVSPLNEDLNQARLQYFWQNLSPKRVFDIVGLLTSTSPQNDESIGNKRRTEILALNDIDVKDNASSCTVAKSLIDDSQRELYGNVQSYLYTVLLRNSDSDIGKLPYDHRSFRKALECEEPLTKQCTHRVYASLLLIAGNYWWSLSSSTLLLSPESIMNSLLKLADQTGKDMKGSCSTKFPLFSSLLISLLSRVHIISATIIDAFDVSEDAVWFLTSFPGADSSEVLPLLLRVFNGGKRKLGEDSIAAIWRRIVDAKTRPAEWKSIEEVVYNAVTTNDDFVSSMIFMLSHPEHCDESMCAVILDILSRSASTKVKICNRGLITITEDSFVTRYRNRSVSLQETVTSNLLNALTVSLTEIQLVRVHSVVVKVTERCVKVNFKAKEDPQFRLSCIRFLAVVFTLLDPREPSHTKTIFYLAGDIGLMQTMFHLALPERDEGGSAKHFYTVCAAAIFLRAHLKNLRRIVLQDGQDILFMPCKRKRGMSVIESQNHVRLLEQFHDRMMKGCGLLLRTSIQYMAHPYSNACGSLFALVAVHQLYATWIMFLSSGTSFRSFAVIENRTLKRLCVQLMGLSIDETSCSSLATLVCESSLSLLASTLISNVEFAQLCVVRVCFQRHISMLMNRLISFPSSATPLKLIYISSFIHCLRIKGSKQKPSSTLYLCTSFVKGLLEILIKEARDLQGGYRTLQCATVVAKTLLREAGSFVGKSDRDALRGAIDKAVTELPSQGPAPKSDDRCEQAARSACDLYGNNQSGTLLIGRNVLYLSNCFTTGCEVVQDSRVACETILRS